MKKVRASLLTDLEAYRAASAANRPRVARDGPL